MTNEQLTAAILDLSKMVAGIQSYLGIPPLQPASWLLPQSAVASLPLVFPYRMPGYGTTLLPSTPLLSFLDMQPTVQPTLQQIEQAMDITTEPAGKMLTYKVSAVVRLQAAARGLLACRRLQEMRQPMHEATLATVDLSEAKRDLAPWDDHQQTRRPAAVFRHEHGVFPACNDLQLCGSGGRGVAPLLVTDGDALPSATAFRRRPPRGRLRWSLSQLIPGGYTRAPLSFQWAPWDPGGYTRAGLSRGGCPPYLQESKIKSRSLFQVNKISRDVKSLFLGVRFVSSRVIISVIVKLQLENELHVQVGCSVRRVKGLLGLSPLGLISRLLRGQVRPLPYIRRGDVSI
jgi:hypothetical protein